MSAEIAGPAAGETAVLVVDMISDFNFEGGHRLAGKAIEAARRIAGLCREARDRGVPVIYVNDNFGQWHSERARLIEHCLRVDSRGREIVSLLLPRQDDYFVIKPQLSGFYATSLPVLLPRLGASRVVLTGVATEMCVLFTAADAHMRAYDLWVPDDCVASAHDEQARGALDIMRRSMGARTHACDPPALAEWIAAKGNRHEDG